MPQIVKKHHRKWEPGHVPVQFQLYVCTKIFYHKYCTFCAILQPKLRKNKVADAVSVQEINLLKRLDYEWPKRRSRHMYVPAMCCMRVSYVRLRLCLCRMTQTLISSCNSSVNSIKLEGLSLEILKPIFPNS